MLSALLLSAPAYDGSDADASLRESDADILHSQLYKLAVQSDPDILHSQLYKVDPDILHSQFRLTGMPVPSAWQPQSFRRQDIDEERHSVGKLTEEQAGPDAMITYIHPSMTYRFAARFSRHSISSAFHTVAADGREAEAISRTGVGARAQ